MLSDAFLEVIFRNIPECLIFIFSGYAFSRYKLQWKPYLISVSILALVGYAIARLLPVEFGISQILVIITCTALLTIINHLPLQKAIGSALGVMILGFITDIIAVIITAIVKGLDIKSILTNRELFNSIFTSNAEQLKYGAISLAIMTIVLVSIYLIAKKNGKLKDVPVGKDIE